MTITPTSLSRAAGAAAVVAGLLFIGVQINHPPMDVGSVTTAEWTIRNTLKVVMAACALAGISGMYLSQVRKNGILGLVGYVVFAIGYLLILSVAFVAGFVLPGLADIAPAYVNDVLAAAAGGTVTGDIGLLQTMLQVQGLMYLSGGFVFGIALFRAGVLARWASALLAVGTLSAVAIPLLPQSMERLFAFPTGIALVGLGYSLWRTSRAAVTQSTPVPDPVGATTATAAGAE